MNIYISGPITGKTRPELISSFGVMADRIRDAGHNPIDPTDTSHWGLGWKTYMQIAIEILTSGEIDAVYMLRGWEDSTGASLEHKWAKRLSIPVYYQEGTE